MPIDSNNTFVEEPTSDICGTYGYILLSSFFSYFIFDHLIHIAPELWKSKTQSKKSDIFAFGITMLEVITRQYAWDKESSGGGRVLQELIVQGARYIIRVNKMKNKK